MDFAECIPSAALYIAEIVTIVRHKKFHNSFYALFVVRAIPDCLGVLNSFYGQRLNAIIGGALYPIYSQFPNWMFAMFFFFTAHTFQANFFATTFILLNRLTAIIMPIKHEKIWRKFLPLITIFVYFVPTLMYWPAFKMNSIFIWKDPNSTTDRNFFIYEAGDAPINHYLIRIASIFSMICLILCLLINICTFVAYKQHLKNVSRNGNNNGHDIEKKLLCYALATFLGHALVAIHFVITDIWLVHDPKTRFMFGTYFPLIMDTGTVLLSSWLLLWASGTFRQQLIKDFAIIRKTNIQNNREELLAINTSVPSNNCQQFLLDLCSM
uniref:Serpentine receptor class gamma n=1 Tax=Globodera rostochiensis TaxID=31243 RepID=A0A914HRN6_GLORO